MTPSSQAKGTKSTSFLTCVQAKGTNSTSFLTHKERSGLSTLGLCQNWKVGEEGEKDEL